MDPQALTIANSQPLPPGSDLGIIGAPSTAAPGPLRIVDSQPLPEPPSALSRAATGLYDTTVGPLVKAVETKGQSLLDSLAHVTGVDDIATLVQSGDPAARAKAVMSFLQGPGAKLSAAIVQPIVNDLKSGNYAGAFGQVVGQGLMLGAAKGLPGAAEALPDAAKATYAGVKAAAPAMLKGAALTGAGMAAEAIPGMGFAGRMMGVFPGVRQVVKGVKAGVSAGRAAVADAGESAEAALPAGAPPAGRIPRIDTGPDIAAAPPAPTPPAAPPAPAEDMDLLDGLARSLAGTKFAKLDAAAQATIRRVAAAPQNVAPEAPPRPTGALAPPVEAEVQPGAASGRMAPSMAPAMPSTTGPVLPRPNVQSAPAPATQTAVPDMAAAFKVDQAAADAAAAKTKGAADAAKARNHTVKAANGGDQVAWANEMAKRLYRAGISTEDAALLDTKDLDMVARNNGKYPLPPAARMGSDIQPYVQMKLRGLWNASRPANAPPVGYAGLAAK